MRNRIDEKVERVRRRRPEILLKFSLIIFIITPLLFCGSMILGSIGPASAASVAEVANLEEVSTQVPTLDLVLQPTPTLHPGLLVAQSISPIFTSEVRYWEKNILSWAEQYDLDPDIVAIIMQIESCGDPKAVSIAGAQGLFQVMPFHFAAGEDSLNPETNAMRGLSYFVGRLEQTGGDIGRSFAGYNGGHVAAANSWDNWAFETQRYYIWTTGIHQDIQAGLNISPTLEKWLQAGGASLCQQAAQRLGTQ